MSAFLVEKDSPGFSVGKVEHKMGIRGSQTTELVFTDCEVPAQSLLGREGEGFKIAMATLTAPDLVLLPRRWGLHKERLIMQSSMSRREHNLANRLPSSRASNSWWLKWRLSWKQPGSWCTEQPC